MKKSAISIFSLILALLLCLVTVSCANKEDKPTDTTSSGTTENPPETEESTGNPEIIGGDWRTWGVVDAHARIVNAENVNVDTLVCLFGDRAEFYADSENQTLLFTLVYPKTVEEPEKNFGDAECRDVNEDGVSDLILNFADGKSYTYLLDIDGEYTYFEEDDETSSAETGEAASFNALFSGFWYPDGDLDSDVFYYISENGEWSLYEVSYSEPSVTDSGSVYSDGENSYIFGGSANGNADRRMTYDTQTGSFTFDGESVKYYSADAG